MNNWQLYETEKQKYIRDHPNATQKEYEEFIKKLTKKLNI